MKTTYACHHQAWVDETLSWDPANYSGIDTLILPQKYIWHPDIIAYNLLVA
jgi:hypothetical protein